MPKLTLRDLFAVVTIVALVLGWWLDHWQMASEVRQCYGRQVELNRAIANSGQKVVWLPNGDAVLAGQ